MRSKAILVSLVAFWLSSAVVAHGFEDQKIVAADGLAGDLFGSAVAVGQGTMVIGAPGSGGTGAAYIFIHDGVSWVQEAKLMASDGMAGDLFGGGVTISGDDVVIGAPGHDASGAEAGAAYVFLRTAGVWSEVTKLLPTGGTAGDSFGISLSMETDTLAVGASRNGVATPGSVFVFTRSASVWSQYTELSAAVPTSNDSFGFSLRLDAGSLLVGAPRAASEAPQTGAAYVFEFTAMVWTETAKLVANDGNPEDLFGYSVSIGEGVVTIGAKGQDAAGANAGAMYNFKRQTGVWSQSQKTNGKNAGDGFGVTVANPLILTVVGADGSDGAGSNSGQLRLLLGPTLIQIYVVTDPIEDHRLGSALSVEGCVIASGAPGDSTKGHDAGAVYVFVVIDASATLVNGSGVNPEIMTTIEAPTIGDHWMVEVDVTGIAGAFGSQIVLYPSMLPAPFASTYGEILVNIAQPRILQNIEIGSAINLHEIIIPNDLSLVGQSAAAQAVFFAPANIGLTNAETLLVGCPH